MALTMEDVSRAEEIVLEMGNLLDEFKFIIRQSGRSILYERFHDYPEGHISMSLSKESNFIGGMFPLDELVEDMRQEVEEENEDTEQEEN